MIRLTYNITLGLGGVVLLLFLGCTNPQKPEGYTDLDLIDSLNRSWRYQVKGDFREICSNGNSGSNSNNYSVLKSRGEVFLSLSETLANRGVELEVLRGVLDTIVNGEFPYWNQFDSLNAKFILDHLPEEVSDENKQRLNRQVTSVFRSWLDSFQAPVRSQEFRDSVKPYLVDKVDSMDVCFMYESNDFEFVDPLVSWSEAENVFKVYDDFWKYSQKEYCPFSLIIDRYLKHKDTLIEMHGTPVSFAKRKELLKKLCPENKEVSYAIKRMEDGDSLSFERMSYIHEYFYSAYFDLTQLERFLYFGCCIDQTVIPITVDLKKNRIGFLSEGRFFVQDKNRGLLSMPFTINKQELPKTVQLSLMYIDGSLHEMGAFTLHSTE